MLGSLPTADDVPLITLPPVANTAPATPLAPRDTLGFLVIGGNDSFAPPTFVVRRSLATDNLDFSTAPATVEVAKVDFSKLGSLNSEDAGKILLNTELERPLTDELLVGSCLRILERPNF